MNTPKLRAWVKEYGRREKKPSEREWELGSKIGCSAI